MKCRKCGKPKLKGEVCKTCNRLKCWNQGHDLIGCLKQRYRTMVTRAKRKGWPPPEFTSKEFVNRWSRDIDYLSIYSTWVASGYDKDLSPSVDRIDPRLPYKWTNIQIIKWVDNNRKGCKIDRKMGTVPKKVVKLRRTSCG